MVALRFLVERVDQWRERARAALANDSIAEIHRLIALLREKPANSDGEMTAAADQSRLLSLLRASPEFGITVIISDCYKSSPYLPVSHNISSVHDTLMFNPLTPTVPMGTAIKHPVPDRVKPSFAIF